MKKKIGTSPAEWSIASGLLTGVATALVIFILSLTGHAEPSSSHLINGLVGSVLVGAVAGGSFGALVYVGFFTMEDVQKQRHAARLAAAEKDAAVAQQEAEEQSRKAQHHRKEIYGRRNAASVESALIAVQKVVASEAARTGWLGEIDFTPDTKVVSENFRKAHAVQHVADKLTALDNPSAEDRRILAEANATVATLESVALKRVELITQCATEAELIDESLQRERADARTAQERAELHAKLSGMLYGIEATPDAAVSIDSAVDGVMARVQAYREVKNAIQQARGESSG